MSLVGGTYITKEIHYHFKKAFKKSLFIVDFLIQVRKLRKDNAGWFMLHNKCRKRQKLN